MKILSRVSLAILLPEVTVNKGYNNISKAIQSWSHLVKYALMNGDSSSAHFPGVNIINVCLGPHRHNLLRSRTAPTKLS